MVGASAPTQPGLFYQWGDIIGHSVTEPSYFTEANYISKRLNLITTSLDEAHDAARAYYGSIAKMPSKIQLKELIDNCTITFRRDSECVFTSNLNSESFTVLANGFLVDGTHVAEHYLQIWSATWGNKDKAYSLRAVPSKQFIDENTRWWGLNIMAVHS